uniref:Ribonuclease H protein At1g65750 family n=1 Tax=Cajanus cajan TaxID=3821 RepID=A0A151SYQ4_CAJCA|nr:Putative ribonuclease H protein At1g65750 family [Cajanus cajan]
MAELWAIYIGITTAWNRGFTKLVVESDSLLAVGLLQNGCSSCHPCFSLVQSILSFVAAGGDFECRHILREANQVADGLANYGRSLTNNLHVFENVMPFISLVVLADVSSTIFLRGF